MKREVLPQRSSPRNPRYTSAIALAVDCCCINQFLLSRLSQPLYAILTTMKSRFRRHKALQHTLPGATKLTTGTVVRQRVELSNAQVADLRERLQKTYQRIPYDFQLEAIRSQIEGNDILVHAATGAGKTTIAAGPHTWIPDGVTLIATPLIQLGEEMVLLITCMLSYLVLDNPIGGDFSRGVRSCSNFDTQPK